MLAPEIQQKLIAETINSAICIDNEYVEAYADTDNAANRETSRKLYEAFRENGLCHLDIYTFKDFATYQRDKDKILHNRDLVILDWELDDNKPCKYEDALAILDDVCQNPQIHFVDIYTQDPNREEIAQSIYSYFKLQKRNELLPYVSAIKDVMEELFDSFELDGFDASVAEDITKDVLREFIMNPTRREQIRDALIDRLKEIYEKAGGDGDFKNMLCSKFGPLRKKHNEVFRNELAFLRAYCICNLCESEKVSQSGIMAKAVNSTTVLVEGTVVHVTSKNNVNPNDLLADLSSAVIGIPKHRSLLLSLLLKQVVGSNLTSVGKVLGKISEETLMEHCKSLKEAGIEEENVSNFVVSALVEHVLYAFYSGESEFSFTDLITLDAGEKVMPSEKEQLLEFNSMLTFIPSKAIKSSQHQIRTGDVFILDKGIEGIDDNGKSHTFQYVLCITQSCDALRPFKVNNNLAFVLGEILEGKDTVDKAETEFFTYLPDKNVVKWSKRFFTIFVANTKLALDNGDRKFTYHYIDGDYTATFLGTQKEAYTHRIINNVFSNAMRIGIDLPHKMG